MSIDPATMMMLAQAASSIAGGLTNQSGYKKVSNFDKGQKDIFKQMGGALQGGGGYQNVMSQLMKYLDPNSQAYEDFEAPYLQQFQEQDLPRLAERFAGAGAQGGALSSSGFGQAIGGAQAGLSANLTGLKEQLRRNSINDILGQYQSYLKQKPFSYVDQPQGGLSSIFTSLGGMQNPFGSPGLGGGKSSAGQGSPLSGAYDTMFRQQGLPSGAF